MNTKLVKHLRTTMRAHGLNWADAAYVAQEHPRRRYRMVLTGAVRWCWVEFVATPTTVRLAPKCGKARYRTAKALIRKSQRGHA